MARNPYGQRSKVAVVPAPVGGWNARDARSAMDQADAVQLDNFIPGLGGVLLRGGYASHVTGLGSAVETLMEYAGITGTNKLFGAAGTSVYDVTSAGAVGGAVVTSTTNARWQHTMFATTGGNYLVCANGAVSVRNYNGTSWSTPSITGVTSANLVGVTAHVSRLWFPEINTLKVWYLDAQAISGAATSIDFGPLCKLGGYLVAMASWSRDGGAGPNDLAVFITSKGQVLIYQGSDPASSTTWGLVGIFKIPEPVGRRCVIKLGADLAIITSQGVVPLSQVLTSANGEAQRYSITDKISGAFLQAYRSGSSIFGWQAIEYPKASLLIVNVPFSDGTQSYQYVQHALTKGWCRFTNLHALSWSMMGDSIYFGRSNGTVYKYDVDYLDDTTSITGVSFPAFNNYGYDGRKHFKMVKPLITADSGTQIPVTLRTEFDTSDVSVSVATIPASGTSWDVGDWDTSAWGASQDTVAEWQTVSAAPAEVASLVIGVQSQSAITLQQTDVLFEPGGAL